MSDSGHTDLHSGSETHDWWQQRDGEVLHVSRSAEERSLSRWLPMPLPSSLPEMTRTGSLLKGRAADVSPVPDAQPGAAVRDSAVVLQTRPLGCASDAAAATDLDAGLPGAARTTGQGAVVLRTVSVERSRLAAISSSPLILPRDSASE